MRGNLKNIFLDFYQQHKYPIWLVVIVLLTLYPFSLFLYIPKWDNINGYLPYRYFISDYLWNGHLPLWNPFQRFGYPGYADLQSGCWYPIVWVLMLFGKYNITSLMVELLITFLVAGLGMFTLSNYVHECKKTALIIGISYALSGFMVGSTQLMVFLIGVAWLPWCIWAILNFFSTFNYKYILWSAVFVSMQITGASPQFTIILAYIFVGIFLYNFWKNKAKIYQLKSIIVGGILLVLTMIIFLLPYIQSFLEFSPYFNRVDKLAYQGFLISNPFVFSDYISFVFPYSVISDCEHFKITDLSLRNAYIGIVGLAAFIVTLTQLNTKNNYFFPLLLAIIVSLIIALGDECFIYKYLYHLPGFGLFRHPSFFRAYTMFSMLLLAGFSIKEMLYKDTFSVLQKRVLMLLTGLFVLMLVVVFSKTSIAEIIENINQLLLLTEIHTTKIYSHLFINILLLLMLGALTYLLAKFTNLSFFGTMLFFMVFDLAIQTRLTAPTTIHYNFSHKDLTTYFNTLPNDLNQHYNNTPFKKLDDTQGLLSTNGIWQNVATFNKTISSVGVNPMRFKSFDLAEENGVLSRNLENPILFFPTQVYHPNDTLKSGFIWDTPAPVLIVENSTSLENINVGYNQFSASISNTSKNEQWLVLNQNYHHLWKAFYNGNELHISKVNEMVMGVQIPKQSSGSVQFIYNSPWLIYAALISIFSYLIVLYWWFLSTRKSAVEQNQNNK